MMQPRWPGAVLSMPGPCRIWLHWLPALLLMVAIFALSSMPGHRVGAVLEPLDRAVSPPAVTVPAPEPWRVTLEWSKVGHVIGYIGLGSAYFHALRMHLAARSGASGRKLTWRAGSLALLLSILYAISDEYHQSFVPGRSASVGDVILDAVAALIGIMVWGLGLWAVGQWRHSARASASVRS